MGLRVLGVRPDGYHELRTIFQTISLFDTLEATRTRARANNGVAFTCDIPEISGGDNLAARAANAMVAELKLPGRIAIHLRKRIPMGAGLGGGSSDAAAALQAVCRLAGRHPTPERMLE